MEQTEKLERKQKMFSLILKQIEINRTTNNMIKTYMPLVHSPQTLVLAQIVKQTLQKRPRSRHTQTLTCAIANC